MDTSTENTEVVTVPCITCVVQEMVPSSEAMPIPVNFPALSLKGQSVEHTTSAGHPLRIPTIFAPQYSGYKFELEGLSQPPGTTLHVSNMTIVDANAEYANMAKSDLLDYFDFGQNSRVCATNRYLAETPDIHMSPIRCKSG